MSREDNLLQIRISGFGGQGVVLMGYVLGKAATIFAGKNATLSQSYGPESRGGASACDILVAPSEIDYPKVVEPHVIVALSQDAFNTYGRRRPPDCVLIVDDALVEFAEEDQKDNTFACPATSIAETLGKKIIANMVMIGFMAGLAEREASLSLFASFIGTEALKQAIRSTVPGGTEKLNLEAFEKGYEAGRRAVVWRKESPTIA